jgi:hypothetical protein
MLKHMVFSQKNAAKKKKCMHMAETKEKTVLLLLKLVKVRFHNAHSLPLSGQALDTNILL